uniref:Serine (or cysteine) peptidase inhibitor, clade B (ovalbumin), member 13 n=1 Tax=Mus musculus TaxID=10090 RepID=D6RHN5_MOUSE
MDSLGTAATQFLFDLFKELNKTNDGNVFFSPVGISTAIGMIILGTRGATASELQKVLYTEQGTESSRIKSEEEEVQCIWLYVEVFDPFGLEFCAGGSRREKKYIINSKCC